MRTRISMMVTSSIIVLAFMGCGDPLAGKGDGIARTLSIASCEGKGSILVDGEEISGASEYTVTAIREYVVEAKPGTGYMFSHWDVGGERESDNPLALRVDEDCTVSAMFTQETPPSAEKHVVSVTCVIDSSLSLTTPSGIVRVYVDGQETVYDFAQGRKEFEVSHGTIARLVVEYEDGDICLENDVGDAMFARSYDGSQQGTLDRSSTIEKDYGITIRLR